MIQLIVHTLDFLGAAFIALAALSVHHRVLHEHKIDKRVFHIMKREQKIGFVGVFCIFASYVLKILIL